VDVVISGHTHKAYVCDYGRANPSRPFLLTSAGQHGTLLTDIRLTIDPRSGRVTAKSADNIIVQSEGFTNSGGAVELTDRYRRYGRNEAVAELVTRYADAANSVSARVVGRLAAPALRASVKPSGEQVLGNLIADAQLAATRAPANGGSRIAFMNPGGVRADLVPGPDGSVTYGQLYAVQPFGNTLVVKSLTGRQIKALLEQQFNSGSNSVERPNILLVSRGFTYAYDLSRPAGQRIIDPRLEGAPLADNAVYRVTMGSFLASGGDNFTIFREGTDQTGGVQDVDALEAYIAGAPSLAPPAADRIRNVTPQ
jgi:5'-nucleotidase